MPKLRDGPKGGPAFPNPEHPGMTLRDYFAARIAAGDAATDTGWSGKPNPDVMRQRANMYYALADAMIEAREIGDEF